MFRPCRPGLVRTLCYSDCAGYVPVPLNSCSGVGEGGARGATAPPPPPPPHTLGHDCTIKCNEEKISSCSMSATVAT